MTKFWGNLKKNYLYLLQAVLPLLLFFIPVFSTTFVESGEEITYLYNIYNIFSFTYEPFLSTVVLFLIVGCGFNLIVFLIYMRDGYKLPIIKREFNIFMLVVNCFLAICALSIFGYAIYLSSQSGVDGIFSFYNSFHSGSVILAVSELVLNMFLIRQNYKKEIEE